MYVVVAVCLYACRVCVRQGASQSFVTHTALSAMYVCVRACCTCLCLGLLAYDVANVWHKSPDINSVLVLCQKHSGLTNVFSTRVSSSGCCSLHWTLTITAATIWNSNISYRNSMSSWKIIPTITKSFEKNTFFKTGASSNLSSHPSHHQSKNQSDQLHAEPHPKRSNLCQYWQYSNNLQSVQLCIAYSPALRTQITHKKNLEI